jgi:hypothetical protein
MSDQETPGSGGTETGAIIGEKPIKQCTDYNADSGPVQFSIVTSRKPATITKTMLLDKDGELIKGDAARLVEGSVETVTVNECAGFADVLTGLKTNQALIYGLPKFSPAELLKKDLYLNKGKPDGFLPRSKDCFHWPDGPAVMMIDYDPAPDEKPITKDELVRRIRDAAPGLADAEMLWWTSASSMIRNDETKEQLAGIRGQRLYIMVESGKDIERASSALCKRLWAAGYGRFEISKSGSMLNRPGIDSSVWQTNRLDYAAGAACTPPLVQDRGDPQLIPGSVSIVNTRSAIPDPDDDMMERVRMNERVERMAKRDEAQEVKAVWTESKIDKLAPASATDDERARLRAVVENAINNNRLGGDFDIILEGGHVVTVGEVLENRAYYHKKKTLDPLEPEYMGNKVVGILYMTDGYPRLFSYAHGGQTYRLNARRYVVNCASGELSAAVDETIDILAEAEDMFMFGETPVVVGGSILYQQTKDNFAQYLGSSVSFNRGKTPIDPPVALVRQVLSPGPHQQRLKPLKAIVDVPVLKSDGTVLSKSGYDPLDQLLYVPSGDEPNIPDAPTTDQVLDALDILWSPFVDFSFSTKDDRAVYLAALLTAATRPTLPTSPVFVFDAPIQGSGKTKLGLCMGLLAGSAAGIYPPEKSDNDEEMRKRLFSAALKGERVVLIDNVVGNVDSPTMASYVTSELITDRKLSKSEVPTIPNKMIFVMTGNNVTVTGDMIRRSLVCRVDPKHESPNLRAFDIDPVQEVERRRVELCAAAMTILRGFQIAEWASSTEKFGSFERWDDVIRQTVLWIGSLTEGFGDPITSSKKALLDDPEVEAMRDVLTSWRSLLGTELVSTKDVVDVMNARKPTEDDPDAEVRSHLRDGLDVLSGGRLTLTPQSLGMLLAGRLGRVAAGLQLNRMKDKKTKTFLWRVEPVS